MTLVNRPFQVSIPRRYPYQQAAFTLDLQESIVILAARFGQRVKIKAIHAPFADLAERHDGYAQVFAGSWV